MLIKPIQRNLLIHSVVHKKVTGIDRFNKPTFDTGTSLTFVRVQPFVKFTIDSSGEKVSKDMFKLFYDSANSRPKAVVFSEDDQIIFKNQTLIIKKVVHEYALDGDTLHHYEIECA